VHLQLPRPPQPVGVHHGAGQALQVGRQAGQVQVPACSRGQSAAAAAAAAATAADKWQPVAPRPRLPDAGAVASERPTPVAAAAGAAGPLLQLRTPLRRAQGPREVQQHLAAALMLQPVRQLGRQPEGAALAGDGEVPAGHAWAR
jgi:hypothetical protein